MRLKDTFEREPERLYLYRKNGLWQAEMYVAGEGFYWGTDKSDWKLALAVLQGRMASRRIKG